MDDRVPLFIVGAGGHGHVVADGADAARFRLLGFVDDDPDEVEDAAHPLLDHEDDALEHAQFIIAVGDNSAREKLFERWCNRSAGPATVIHPTAIVSQSAQLGEGVFIGPGVVVNARANIGDNVILNTACIVEHDCTIESHTHIAPRATLAGGVTVGQHTLVGLGATILPRLTIGSHTTIGAGAVILQNAPNHTTLVGVPGKAK